MTTSVVTLVEHQSLRLASARSFARGEDDLPVVDDAGRFIGLVNHRDVVAAERSHILARRMEGREPEEPAVLLSELVTRNVETVSAEASIRSAVQQMLRTKLGLVPVVDGSGDFVGLVSMEAMLSLCSEWAECSTRRVADIMTRALVTATSETRAGEAIDLMVRAQVRHLPVVDENGRLESVVGLRDLLAYQRALYEKSGERVTDICLGEFMGGEAAPRPWTVSGTTSIADAVRTLRDNRFGCLPIVEESHLLGIVTDSDVLAAFLEESSVAGPGSRPPIPIRHYMSAASLVVSPSDSVAEALKLFVECQAETVLVVAEGVAVGLLAKSDLTHALHIPRFCGADEERADLMRLPVTDLMSRGIITVDATKDVREAAAVLVQSNFHHLIVVDDHESVGCFGAREIYQAAGALRVPTCLKEIMTNVVFEIDCQESLRSGLRFLERAGVRGLIVRDGDWPVGVFGNYEALASAAEPLQTRIDQLMSPRVLCLPHDMPSYRAAEQAAALGVNQIVVTQGGNSCGLVSSSDFVPLLALSPIEETREDTLDTPLPGQET